MDSPTSSSPEGTDSTSSRASSHDLCSPLEVARGRLQPVRGRAEVARAVWSTVEADAAVLELDVGLTVEADPPRLRQLFENLFRNSVEHGAVDSTVALSVRVVDRPDRRGFAVEDDGDGIPEADRETVFDRGYTTWSERTGLGLCIVDRIVEATAGRSRRPRVRPEARGSRSASTTASTSAAAERSRSLRSQPM